VISSALPNLDALDVEALKALVMAQHSELQKQQQSNTQQIEHLKLVIEKYRQMLFGRKSEKLAAQLDQLEFQLEELETAEAAAEFQQRCARTATKPRSRPQRKSLPEDLPREVITHLSSHTCCPDCSGATRQFGQDVSEQLERTPAQYKVIQHVRSKFACAACQGEWKRLLRRGRLRTGCRVLVCWRICWSRSSPITVDPEGVGLSSNVERVISPLLSNLFLHYVFDVWLERGFPGVPFERYADEIICHCRSEHEAAKLRKVLERRFLQCGLELHAEKTKVVYCKDTNRKRNYANQQFDFLGYSFRPRKAKWPSGSYGTSFLPAASPKALKAIRKTVRGWGLQRRSNKALDDLARMFNPYIRGWINYYGHFYQSALYPTLRRIDEALINWVRRKFKTLYLRTILDQPPEHTINQIKQLLSWNIAASLKSDSAEVA
jgi:Group II intron, maturase-specific domain/Transposase C of IS166 homeodomain/Reverse transcriptase (RNA-dependent DNA polymerase)/zinc-finger binding domain of transposase IS66